METLIKKYFWMANLIFLALAAWLVAGSINSFVAHKLHGIPSVGATTTQKKTAGFLPNQSRDNQVVVRLNLFGSAMAAPFETMETGPDINDGSAQDLVDGAQSSLRATLVGTVVASDKTWSLAMITDHTGSSQPGGYHVNDLLMGEATVLEIFPKRVYISRSGVREYLDLQEKASPKTPGMAKGPAPENNPPPSASDAALAEGIKKVNENNYVIQRKTIDDTLSNLNNIAMQARIVPSFNNGEANGFKLFAIRPGSLYSKIGIQNGDIIQKINGFPMSSPDKALEIYQKLKTASSVDVEVVRRGQTQKMSYQIQ